MNRFKLVFNFKQGKNLNFEIDTEEDLRETLHDEWEKSKKDGTIIIGEYLIKTEDLRWLRIEGETLNAEPSGTEIQNN